MKAAATSTRPLLGDPQSNNLQIPILNDNALRKLATEPNSSKFAIDAHNRAITEIGDLSELPKLCSLDVSFNRLTSLKNVHTAKELRELKAYNNKLTTLRFLRGNGNLEGLLAHENQIEEIAEDLLALVKLKALWLNGNHLTKVQNLGSCRLLVHLDLSRNRLTDCAAVGLDSLSSLEYLNLSGNLISSIGNLTHLTKLEELNLASNRLATLEGGLLPANVSVLRLNDNKLTSLQSFPPYLTKLNELYLQDNAIAEIGEHAAKFPELESLDLRNNRIRSVAQLQSGLARCSSLADLWIQGNSCCLSQTYLLDVMKALPELRTLDSMTDTQLKAQMDALKNGVITQDALLATLAPPMTPRSSRPGSASSYRPTTPSSAGSSRPTTPDRAAPPVFHKPSARTGTLLKVASPDELERAHADVAERLQSMKALLGRIGKGEHVTYKENPTTSTRSQRAVDKATTRESRDSFRKNSAHNNQVAESRRGDVRNAVQTTAKPRSRGVDAGTDPIDSLMGSRRPPPTSRPTASPETITPRRAMETQTPREPVVVLPPAPVAVAAASSPAAASKPHQLVDAAAMTSDNQTTTTTKEEMDGAAIEREMKQFLLAHVTPRADKQPQNDDDNQQQHRQARGDGDGDGGGGGDDDDPAGESPRIVSNKVAEQRLPPNPRSRRGYRTFRIPARLRGGDEGSCAEMATP